MSFVHHPPHPASSSSKPTSQQTRPCEMEAMSRNARHPQVGQSVRRPIPIATRPLEFTALELAVAETSRARKLTNKSAEKSRRDRLREAVEQLIKTTAEPCCIGNDDDGFSFGPETQTESSLPSAQDAKGNSRAGAVEFSVDYITCLKAQVQRLQQQLERYGVGRDGEDNGDAVAW